MSEPSQLQLLHFEEFEAYTTAIEDANLRSTVPKFEDRRWTICHLPLGSLHIQQGYEGSGHIAEGECRSDGYLLFVQRTGQRCLANGEVLQEDSVMLIGPGEEFCLASADAHDWYSVFLPLTHLETEGMPIRSGLYQAQPGDLLSLTGEIDGFTHTALCGVPSLVELPPAVDFRQRLVERVMQLLGLEQSVVRSDVGRPKVVDRRLIRQAVDRIEATGYGTISVAQLSQELEVSERALRDGFREHLGVAPKKFIQLRSLHRARQLLVHFGPDETTVSSVATGIGMWDLGRFAMRYRELFGESPSQTLQRTNRGK